MSRQEKNAWFNLGVFALAATLFAIAFPHIGLRATGCLGILGLWGFGPAFYRRGKAGVNLDEREQTIQRRAHMAGYSLFWVSFVVFIMFTWHHHRGGTITIQADNLPLFLIGGMAVLVMTESIAMLLLSKRGVLHG